MRLIAPALLVLILVLLPTSGQHRLPPAVLGSVGDVAALKAQLVHEYQLQRKEGLAPDSSFLEAGEAYIVFLNELKMAVDRPEDPRRAMAAAYRASQAAERFVANRPRTGERTLILAATPPIFSFAASVIAAAAQNKDHRPALKQMITGLGWPQW